MRIKVTLLLVLAVIFMFGACSSSSEDKTVSKNSALNAQNGANSTSNGNTAVVTNGMVVPAQPGDANANAGVDTASDALQPSDMMQKRLS